MVAKRAVRRKRRAARSAKPLTGSQLRAKKRQTSKLAEIRKALIASGHDTVHKQAFALGVIRSTAWTLLNGDKRVGPSAKLTRRILASPHLPRSVRHKLKEYIEAKIRGVFGHGEQSRKRWARNFEAYLR